MDAASSVSSSVEAWESLRELGAAIAIYGPKLANNKNAKTAPKKCWLLSMPPEIRTRIWENVLKGGKYPPPTLARKRHSPPKTNLFPFLLQTDGGVIHVDLQHVWGDIEMQPRLNFTLTCTQIRAETRTMFLPHNTFLFKARDHRVNFALLENVADWLNWVPDEQIASIGRIVVCSKLPIGRIKYAWTQVGYMGMDVGFEVGERIDTRVGEGYRGKGGLWTWDYESWGKEDGHCCAKCHYEIFLPEAKKDALAAEMGREEA